jgi:hypothetical protein
MKMKWNITKEYLVDKPVNVVFDELDVIITEPYSWMRDDGFMGSGWGSITGHFVGGDPPEFTICFRKNKSQGWNLSVVLYKQEDKTKIVMQTTSNYMLYIMAIVVVVGFIASLFTSKLAEVIKTVGIYVGAMAFLFVVDILAQRALVAQFERRMKLS